MGDSENNLGGKAIILGRAQLQLRLSAAQRLNSTLTEQLSWPDCSSRIYSPLCRCNALLKHKPHCVTLQLKTLNGFPLYWQSNLNILGLAPHSRPFCPYLICPLLTHYALVIPPGTWRACFHLRAFVWVFALACVAVPTVLHMAGSFSSSSQLKCYLLREAFQNLLMLPQCSYITLFFPFTSLFEMILVLFI